MSAKKIALLSDTHGWLDPLVLKYAESCDEIWHAGDIGDLAVTDALAAHKPLYCVYGNIDDLRARALFKANIRRSIAGLDIWMTHIGGRPGAYPRQVREAFSWSKPGLFICGHTHILRVMYDKRHEMLYVNPGAAGRFGIHTIRTMLRFQISEGRVHDMEVIELGDCA